MKTLKHFFPENIERKREIIAQKEIVFLWRYLNK